MSLNFSHEPIQDRYAVRESAREREREKERERERDRDRDKRDRE